MFSLLYAFKAGNIFKHNFNLRNLMQNAYFKE